MKGWKAAGMCLLLAGTALSEAAPTGSVKYVVTQDLIKRSTLNGVTSEDVLPNPKSVIPGDILRETVTLTNTSGKVVKGVIISVAMPAGTIFATHTSGKSDRWKVLYSRDGGQNYSPQPMSVQKVSVNGKVVARTLPVPVEKYTHIRWEIGQLKAHETLKLSFRVRVKK